MKVKNSNFDETQLKLWCNSKTQIVMNLKNSRGIASLRINLSLKTVSNFPLPYLVTFVNKLGFWFFP